MSRDDATPLAYAVVLADEVPSTAVGFLRDAIALYRRDGAPADTGPRPTAS